MKEKMPANVAVGWCLLVLFSIPAIIWNAYVLACLWGWFMVPLGFPIIGLAHAYGLYCFVRFFVPINYAKEPETENSKSPWFRLGLLAFKPALFLGIGYVAKQLMTGAWGF